MDTAKLVREFTARLSMQGHAPGTVVKYTQGVTDFLEWWGKDPVLAKRADIESHLDDWHARTGAGASSIRLRISALKKLFDYLDSRGLLVDAEGRELRNPTDRVTRPKSNRKANDWLSEEESTALLGAATTPQEQIVVDLLRWTGMRVGEACALTWKDVDLEGDMPSIRVRMSKTASGIRTVVALPELVEGLRRWQAHLQTRGLYKAGAPVLTTRAGTAMKPQFAWRVLKRVAARGAVRKQAAADASGFNVSEISPHTLRRTFATDLLNRGVRLETISQALGHKDTRVTQEYYAELLDKTAGAEILAAMAS